MNSWRTLVLVALLGGCLGVPGRADEGMWTFHALPATALKDKYAFDLDPAWVEHLRLSCVDFGNGSGAFVSGEGLVLTNHHVVQQTLASLKGAGKDLLRDGFVAPSREQEIKTPLALRVLRSMTNITAEVKAKAGTRPQGVPALQAEQTEFFRRTSELAKESGLDCRPISLFSGSEYWVYGYETFRDVRLVAAPEVRVAEFGGDPENFSFPRHNLDFALLRVYQGGQPYHPAHFLQASSRGVQPGELTFVAGNPEATRRDWTLAQMEYARDVTGPLAVAALERRKATLLDYVAHHPAAAPGSRSELYRISNALKAEKGYLEGLQDPVEMERLRVREADLKQRVQQNPRLAQTAGRSWERIAQALALARTIAAPMAVVQGLPDSPLLKVRRLVHQGLRDPKAPPLQIPMSTNSSPFDTEIQWAQVGSWLVDSCARLGPGHSYSRLVRQNGGVDAFLRALRESPLNEEPARVDLRKQGPKGIRRSKDPLVQMSLHLERMAKEAALPLRTKVDPVVHDNGTRIARARYELLGPDLYPEASSSLRLTFGPLGLPSGADPSQRPFTTLGGMFLPRTGAQREEGIHDLPQRWLEAKEQVDPAVPLNFCLAVDVIGGSSGSPVVNRGGELVGLVFDGNAGMLAGRYYYDRARNRAMAVDLRAILESLGKVYGAPQLMKELAPGS